MPPAALASPVAELRGEYQVVVVGSGYGAGVCASRLAEAGAEVCVLERGREVRTGEFPTTLEGFRDDSQWDAGPLALGKRSGLFDFRVGPDVNVVVGCGLGGTSLINANVSTEPDPRIFDGAAWPEEIRAARRGGTLAWHYQLARNVLRPVEVPGEEPAKLRGLRDGAAAATDGGLRPWSFARLPLNVHFGAPGPNPFGVEQRPCVRCGDCVTGCNFDAKSTLPYNYLPLARHHGARLFTLCEVRTVSRHSDGKWELEVLDVGSGATRVVVATVVVLAGGVLGSTEILMRSREQRGLALSARLGSGFSSNGDSLTFGYNTNRSLDSVGIGGAAVGRSDHLPGPSILGVIDKRSPDAPPLEGVMIEDGIFPSSLAGALRRLLPLFSLYGGTHTPEGFFDWIKGRWPVLKDLLGTSDGDGDGALERTQLYLGIGHDGADGRLVAGPSGRLGVSWPGLRSGAVFGRTDAATRAITYALGGTHVADPLFSQALGNQLVTVHPLGGCPMGSDGASGVVDHAGKVFAGDAADTSRRHTGLYVADGSIIPSSLGVNPLLTIAALSERIAEGIARDLGLQPRASWSIAPPLIDPSAALA